MKKTVAVVMASVMLLMIIFLSAYAASGPLTADQEKELVLALAGVVAADAVFTVAYHRRNDGRTKASCSGAPIACFYGDDPDGRSDLDHDRDDEVNFDGVNI